MRYRVRRGDFVSHFLFNTLELFMQLKLKITAAAAIAVACGVVSAQGVQVVKLGHVAPMSGSQAHYGKDNANGSMMAVEDLNAQNIVIGGKKIKFELMAED